MLATPEQDRSLQYGSEVEAVRGLFEGVRAQDVVEEVLEGVEVPV